MSTPPASQQILFTVAVRDAAGRLDVLVANELQRRGLAVSRATVQQWIAGGHVLVDGLCGKPAHRVRAGTRLVVTPQQPPPTEAVADESVLVAVMYEDEHLIVLNKPSGLVVHPAKGHLTGTLVNGLLARGSFDRRDACGDGGDYSRPGIVHRLDKDTSGVLVVAKTAQAREGLKALFSRHDIERVYHAIVVGDARGAHYDTPHGRHPVQRLKFSSSPSGPARRAVTDVNVVESLAGGRATLVECRLETGRTHQIRVHLAECGGTPVLGDALYGRRIRDPQIAAIAAELARQWLHASVLGFIHPATGKFMHFQATWPPELQVAISQLRALG